MEAPAGVLSLSQVPKPRRQSGDWQYCSVVPQKPAGLQHWPVGQTAFPFAGPQSPPPVPPPPLVQILRVTLESWFFVLGGREVNYSICSLAAIGREAVILFF